MLTRRLLAVVPVVVWVATSACQGSVAGPDGGSPGDDGGVGVDGPAVDATGPRPDGDVPMDGRVVPPRGDGSVEPPDASSPDAGTVTDDTMSIATGGYHSCARVADGRLFCWGANNARQVSNVPFDHTVPIAVEGLSAVATVSLGYEFSGALDATGVFMWGANNTGQLGDGTTTTAWTPTAVDAFDLEVLPTLTFGHWHSCSIVSDGTVACSGHNSNGELGQGTVDATPTDHPDPALVVGLSNVTQISNGYFHNCARLADRSAVCWGNNGAGQSGTGERSDAEPLPVPVVGLPGTVRQVAAGSVHSCAALDDGTVWCWGGSGSGQLGRGSTSTSLAPVEVAGPTNVVQIATSSGHVCAVTSARELWCWGRNTRGQIGNDSLDNQLGAVRLSLTDVVEVAAGERHSCARRGDGSVWCWGANDRGQVGDGTTTDRGVPTEVTGLP